MQEGAAENVTILLLGNKSDCAERQVKSQDAEILAKVWSWLRHCILSHSQLVIYGSLTTSAKSFWSSNTLTKGSGFTPTGVQLSVHGVQRCHWWKCDSVFGNCGQVTHFTSVTDFSFILCHPSHLHDCLKACSLMFIVLTDCVFARMLSQKVDTREETTLLHKEPQQKKSSGCCWIDVYQKPKWPDKVCTRS